MKRFQYLFLTLIVVFSCKDQKENLPEIEEKKAETSRNIQVLYKNFSADSIEVKVDYTSDLDTIDSTGKNERFTFLYWTKADISTKEFEEIIENDDKQRMKEENLMGYNLEDKRSLVFNYNFNPNEENYLTILVEDLAFIRDFDKDSTRIIQNISTIKEKVFVSRSH